MFVFVLHHVVSFCLFVCIYRLLFLACLPACVPGLPFCLVFEGWLCFPRTKAEGSELETRLAEAEAKASAKDSAGFVGWGRCGVQMGCSCVSTCLFFLGREDVSCFCVGNLMGSVASSRG